MNVVSIFTFALKRATAERRMLVLLYVINVIVAAVLALAFRSVLISGFGFTMATSELMQGLNFNTFQEFMLKHGAEVGVIFSQIGWYALLYIIINTLLAGGILATLREKETRFTVREFFAGCVTYFFRFFRLFLLFGILLILLAVIWMVVLGALFSAVTAGGSSEVPYIVWTVVTVILFFVPLMVLLVIADYAKVGTVLSNTHAMVRAAWRSAKFVFRNFLKVMSLHLLMLLVPIALFIIYVWLDLSIGMTTVTTILVMFVIQQIFILTRVWTRVFFFSGELELYSALQPRR